MSNYIGSAKSLIIENLPKEYISANGVLDLTRACLFGYSFNLVSNIPKGIKTNAIKGILREIIFPEEFQIYQPDERSECQNLSHTGVRKFNIPKTYSCAHFASLVINKNITKFIDYIKTAGGPLKYSELIITLNISKKRIKELLQYYKGISWIQDISKSIEKAIIIEEETYQHFDVKNNELVLKVLESLLILIKKGYIFNIRWQLAKTINIEEENNKDDNPLCNYEIDDNGKIVINFETNGDTYVIRIDDISEYSTASIPLPLEAANAFQILFDNIEILRYILQKAESKMSDDISKGKVFMGDVDTITKRPENTRKSANLLADPRIHNALIRKKHCEANGNRFACARLNVEPSFIIDNFEEIKKLNLLPYFDLSEIDSSKVNLTETDLSYSNMRIKIIEGMSLKETNLMSINLCGQIITNQDITGANLTMTNAIIVFPGSYDETTIFDETCYFINYRGEPIPYEVLRADGYNIKPIPKDVYIMKVGHEQFHIMEPSYEELINMGLSKDNAELLFTLNGTQRTLTR